jgi:hypothetical protein
LFVTENDKRCGLECPAGVEWSEKIWIHSKISTVVPTWRCRARFVSLTHRVTRFGKFSPIGRLFTLKMTELELIFPHKLLINFDNECVWLNFGRFFWHTHLVTLLTYLHTLECEQRYVCHCTSLEGLRPVLKKLELRHSSKFNLR